MRAEQAIALVALILGIIGGVLLISGGIRILSGLVEGNIRISFDTMLLAGVGITTIAASITMWTGRYVAGGAINITLGILMVFYGELQQGLIILVSGILGIVAPKIKD